MKKLVTLDQAQTIYNNLYDKSENCCKTINNVGVAEGTSNIILKASDIPVTNDSRETIGDKLTEFSAKNTAVDSNFLNFSNSYTGVINAGSTMNILFDCRFVCNNFSNLEINGVSLNELQNGLLWDTNGTGYRTLYLKGGDKVKNTNTGSTQITYYLFQLIGGDVDEDLFTHTTLKDAGAYSDDVTTQSSTNYTEYNISDESTVIATLKFSTTINPKYTSTAMYASGSASLTYINSNYVVRFGSINVNIYLGVEYPSEYKYPIDIYTNSNQQFVTKTKTFINKSSTASYVSYSKRSAIYLTSPIYIDWIKVS